MVALVVTGYGILGTDDHRQVGHIEVGRAVAGDGHCAGAGNLAATHRVVVERELSCLGAGILRGEVEGHHLLGSSRNLGLDHGDIFAVLINLLVGQVEVEFAVEAVYTVVLHRHVALFGGAGLLTTTKLKLRRLQVDQRVIGQRGIVAIDIHLDVIAVALEHGLPLVAALLHAHGNDAVGAVADALAEVVVLRVIGLRPVVGHRQVARVDVAAHNQLQEVAIVVIQGDAAAILGAVVDVVLGSDLDVAALVEREALAATIKRAAAAAIVHVEHRQHMVHLLAGTTVTGLDADDGRLVDVVALGAARRADAAGMGVEHRQHKVAVAHATPTPVDVVVVAILIAVAHKRVTAATAGTAVVDHRAAGGQLLIDHVLPSLLVVVAAIHQLGIVVKVVVQRLGDIGVARARCRQAIFHLGRAAGIEHQPRHCLGVDLVLSAGVGVAHVLPVKSDWLKSIGDEGAVFFRIRVIIIGGVRRDGLAAPCGPVVILHDLCHRCGYTACVGQFADGVAILHMHKLGAVVPVGGSLVPVGGDHRGNRVARVHCRGAARSGQTSGGLDIAHRGQGLQLAGIAVEHALQVGGNLGGVEVTHGRVAQDGGGAVVATDDDKAVVIAHIVDVVIAGVGGSLHGGRLRRHAQCALCALFLLDECCGGLACLVGGHWACQ